MADLADLHTPQTNKIIGDVTWMFAEPESTSSIRASREAPAYMYIK